MKPNRLIFLVILLAVVGVFCSRQLQTKEIIPWRSDYTAARAEAADSGKPVLLYFTASWCPPCQTMKKTTWADAMVAAKLEGYTPVKVDMDQSGGLANFFGVQTIPALRLLDADGRPTKSADGLLEPVQFVTWLEK